MRILSWMRNRKIKGSITVFMTFIFILIFSLVLVFFENTRIISSKGYVKNASSAAEKTLFGDYNKELFEEYGLFGYGGYNGMSSDDMLEDFKNILLNNLTVKPENSKISYTDVYKIKKLEIPDKNFEGFADGDNLYSQIKEFIINDTLSSSVNKIKNKYSKGTGSEQGDLREKLDDGDSYETGKYKEKYEKKKDGNKKDTKENTDTKKKTDTKENMDTKKNMNTKEDKTEENEEIENPLENFKELIEDGYLSLVCDTNKLSDAKIEKVILSDDDTEDNVNNTAENKYESAGSYLKDLLVNNNKSLDEGNKSFEKDKTESIVYANKVFSSYVCNREKTVEYGMEYLICGNEKEKDNLTGVVSRIIAARMVTNFAAILSDKTIYAKSLATATAIAGITGLEPVIKGVQYVILAIMAFEESCVDTAALLDGRQIPIVKKMTDIKITYEEICLVSGELLKNKAKQYNKSDGKIVSSYIDYNEYLFCFAACVSKEKIKTRIFDVIQYDLRTRYNESFCIYDCIVAADFEITYDMNFIFPYLWNLYGKELKNKNFKRKVMISYGYDR